MARGKESRQITRIAQIIQMFNNILQIAKQEKKEIIKLMVVFSLALFVLFVGWDKVLNSEAYQSFTEIYNNFTAKIATNFGSVLGIEIKYYAESSLISTDSHSTKLMMPVDGYKYFLIGFSFLVLVPLRNWNSTISIFIFILLFLALRAGFVTFMLLIYKNTIHNIILLWVDPTIFIAMLILGVYIVKHNLLLSHIYLNIEQQLSESLTISLSNLLFLLIVIPPLPRVIFTYIHSDIMPGIVSFILYISKFFIELTGKTAEVSGRFIHLDNNWIDLEYPCIGLGVFTLVAVLIFAIRGNFTKKILYLSNFAFIYLLLNALRLSVLLMYINKTYNEIGLNKVELHDNATYFMYVVAFAGFMGYWFGVGRKTIN